MVSHVVSLVDLPEEIISCIISHVDPKSLSEISLCSKSLQRITLPYLYRHITLSRKEAVRKRYGYWGYQLRRYRYLRYLTSLFLRKPYYASLVRCLTILDGSDDVAESSEDVTKRSIWVGLTEGEEVIKTAIKASSHSKEEEYMWLRDVGRPDNDDALLAIMLPTLVRLRKLDLKNMEGMNYFERTIARIGYGEKPFDIQPALSLLTDIVHTEHNAYHKDSAMSPKYIGLLLLLPAIQFIHAYLGRHYIDGDDSEIILATLPTSSSGLTHLELLDSIVPSDNLLHILRASKNLKTFIYEARSSASAYGFSTPVLQEALKPAEKCLTNLWLDCYEYSDSFFASTEAVKPMNFSSFTSLMSLHVQSVFLFGDPAAGGSEDDQKRLLRGVFPHQLKILEIVHRGHSPANLLVGLKDLFQEKQAGNKIADLERLAVVPGGLVWQDFWDDILTMLPAAEKMGVVMTLRNWRPTPMSTLLTPVGYEWEKRQQPGGPKYIGYTLDS